MNLSRLTFTSAIVLWLFACSTQTLTSTPAKSMKGSAKTTFARFVPERADDFAWENDVIAFRAYGPALRSGAENSGVDCWLKRVDYPIIDKWYKQALRENKSYHQDHGEGLDNYHVGSSAGCGGTALWINDERVALETFTEWKITLQTPVKTTFELQYQSEINGDVYQEIKEISIELGQHLYQVRSHFYKNGAIAPNLEIAIGLTTHDGKAKVQFNEHQGWLSAWEAIGDSQLGTGIKLSPDVIERAVLIESHGEKDKGHAVFIAKTNQQGELVYHAGYGWEKAQYITSERQWQDYLTSFQLHQ